MSKYVMRMSLILCVIACGIWTMHWGDLVMEKYNANMADINVLQTPVEIMDKYMFDKYNRYWRALDEVVYAGDDEEFVSAYIYEIAAIESVGEEVYDLQYIINESAEYGIGCETITGYPGTHIVSRYYYPERKITRIYCSVDVYGGDMKGWIDEFFEIFYEDGQYYMCRDDGETVRRYSEAEVAEIEAKTGFTIEEMVDIAYDGQAKLEEIIYDVKEQAKVIEKRRMYRRLFILSIQPVCLIGMGIGFEIMMRKSRAKKGKEV